MEQFEKVFDDLETTIGKLVRVSTGRKVILAEDDSIPKPDGEFVLLQTLAINPTTWEDNVFQDVEGRAYITHSYTVTYLLTAYRGRAYAALSRVLQAINLPMFYDKYFPLGSCYSYSNNSTISPQRVPLNKQKYENRATVMLTFNVRFAETDIGAFEDLEGMSAEIVTHYPAPDDINTVTGSGQ
ncbi:phage neck terminator protein [Escherichia coli]|uniref:phage neck terminator protein n=1 Tax=Escherichia coli TaxID=562 RepID=UPI000CFDCAC6|nr:hypothetical protein [Escherichia coli]